MDGRKFDHLTQSVAQITSRRGAVRALVAGLVAAATGRAGLEPVAAQLGADACV